MSASTDIEPSPLAELLDQLERTTQLPRPLLRRVVAEVIDAYREPVEAVVRRRHRELHAGGMSNPAIWPTILRELATRVVSPPELSERQLRRIIYG